MASYVWIAGTSGNWSDPANWSPNGVPGSADSVSIDASGTYQVLIDVPAIGMLSLDAPGATLALQGGTIALSGVLDLQAGTLSLTQTVSGGTIRLDGGSIAYQGGTLDGVTVQGALDLSADSATLFIKDGISFGGTKPEQILITGAQSQLVVGDDETLDNVAITLGNTSSTAYLFSNTALTLGVDSTLTTSGNAYISGPGFDNQGSITAATGALSLQGSSNEGSIAISDGTLYNTIGSFSYNGAFTNSGTITVSGTGTGLQLGQFANTGTIAVESGGTLSLTGAETYDQLGSITSNDATVRLGGTLDMTGHTLDLTAGSVFDGAQLTGTIHGGTLAIDGGSIAYEGGTFDGVTVQGALDLSADTASLSIKDGISFAGTGPEQILITGAQSQLVVGDDETLDNVAITLGNASSTAYLYADATLTLGTDSTLTTSGNAVISGTGFDNQGSITAATGTLTLYGSSNEGSIAISDGYFYNTIRNYSGSTIFANSGTITVSGTGTGLQLDQFANTGTIAVESGGTLSLTGAETYDQLGTITSNDATVRLAGTLDLTGHTLDLTAGSVFDGAQLTGTIHGGTLAIDGGSIAYEGGTFDGVTVQGALDLSADSATLSIKNGIGFAGTGPEQILITGARSQLVVGDDETLDNVAITLGNASSTAYLYADATLTLGTDSTLTTSGNAVISGTGFDNQGSITAATGTLTLYGSSNEGSIAISDGYFYNTIRNYSGSTIFANSGTITVSGTGTGLQIGQLDNAGTIGVYGGGTLEITQPTTALGTVAFLDRSATVTLSGTEGGYDGTLSGFAAGDVLDLQGTGYALQHSGNTLTVSQNGAVIDSFALTGQDYATADFTLTATDASQTLITSDAPCFCAGTLIRTARGQVPVETILPGDRVLTRQDGVAAWLAVRWVGHRRVSIAQHPAPEQVMPVRIVRDAIAPGRPSRDLLLSPDHALHLDGLLVQARQLVNGMTIRCETGLRSVTYHHVELERHAILLAENLPCESYLDSGNRGQFDNGGAVVTLHPNFETNEARRTQSCATLATDAETVRPIWQRLQARALESGHVAPSVTVSHAPELRLALADGRTLAPLNPSDGPVRFSLPPDCARVRLVSSSDRPTTLSPWCDDRRRLGVAISGVGVAGGGFRRTLALSDLRASDGWWSIETHADKSWRWTDGAAWIDLPAGTRMLVLDLHAVMPTASVAPETNEPALGLTG